MIRRSRECVINLPTTDLVNEVIGIGNCSGAEVDKFEALPHTRPCHKGERPVDQGVLCEF
jgi:flavin reductase (DIM6/NTAB) family NADH-FMN oxidoreductase RutF